MLSLLRTSKSMLRSMKEAMAVAYSIDVRLKTFFSDPQAFRRVQAECNALLTGSFARAFFANELMPQRLCILVDEDGAASIRAFIETNGFPLEKNISLIGPNNDPLYQEISACDMYKCAANGRLIYLFITTQTGVPLNALLCNSMSTGQLSFLSWNKAYALYPRHTFLEKETYLLQNIRDRLPNTLWRQNMQDFANSGIKAKGLHWDEDSDPIAGIRRVGDQSTWTIGLNVSNIKLNHRPIPDAILESTSFAIRPYTPVTHDSFGGHVSRYTMGATKTISSPILKYKYVVHEEPRENPEYQSAYFRKLQDIHRSLHDQLRIELMELPVSSHPAEYQDVMEGRLHMEDLKMDIIPNGWTYYDDDLVKYLAKLHDDHEKQEAAHGKDRSGYMCRKGPDHGVRPQ